MRYNRAALAQAVAEAIEADRLAWAIRVQERHNEVLDDTADWMNRYAEKWAEAALAIRRKLRRGEPVVKSDVPTADQYGNYPAFFSPRSDRNPAGAEFKPSDDLLVLAKALEVVADETITAAGLRELGVTAATMRRCTMHLARSSATA